MKRLFKSRTAVRRFGVKRLGLFGSFIRGEQKRGSDIDLLVELKEKTFDNYMDLKLFLEKQLKAKVDLVLTDSLKPQLKARILKEVEYAEGI